jgi:predicted metal-binding protein
MEPASNEPATAANSVTVFVCVTCKRPDADEEPRGRLLFEAVRALLPSSGTVTVTPVKCLAVCKRPCTVALTGAGKWTSIVGDLDHQAHAGDVIAAALSHAATEDGIIPWRQRPASFRKGVVARIPPLGFQPAEPGL